MSDQPLPYQPKPLMSAIRARNLSRRYKAFAEHLHASGYGDEADQASREARRWLNHAIALSQIPPGAIDKDGLP